MITDEQILNFFSILEIFSYIILILVIIVCVWIEIGIRRKKKGLPDFKYFPIYKHDKEK